MVNNPEEIKFNDSAKVEKVEAKNKKNKNDKEEVNWFVKVLKEEYKWETYLLGVISCFAIGVGALFLSNAIEFKYGWLYEYQTLIGWFFEIVGIFGFLLFIIPIFKPTKSEIKMLTLPTKNSFITNVIRVFTFIIILALILVLFESVLSAILGKIVGS